MVRNIIYNGKLVKLPRYIYQNRKGRFEIRKAIKGTLLYWGSFPTLEEAKLYLAYYIGKKWMVNPHFLNRRYIYQKEENTFHIQKRDENGNLNYFGSFNTLEEAKKERDICITCNWDMDCIVEFGDTIKT